MPTHETDAAVLRHDDHERIVHVLAEPVCRTVPRADALGAFADPLRSREVEAAIDEFDFGQCAGDFRAEAQDLELLSQDDGAVDLREHGDQVRDLEQRFVERSDATIWRMRSHGVRRLPVVDANGVLQGLIAFDDLVDYLAEELGRMAAVLRSQQHKERALRPSLAPSAH